MKQALIERMLYIVLALVFVAASVASYIALQAIDEFNHQQKVLNEQINSQKQVLQGMEKLLSSQGNTTEDINKSLSCILVFFGSANRQNYRIEDLSRCTIVRTDTGEQRTLQVVPVPQEGTQKPQQSTAPSSSPTPSQPSKPSKPPVTSKPEENRGIGLPLIDNLLKIVGL